MGIVTTTETIIIPSGVLVRTKAIETEKVLRECLVYIKYFSGVKNKLTKNQNNLTSKKDIKVEKLLNFTCFLFGFFS